MAAGVLWRGFVAEGLVGHEECARLIVEAEKAGFEGFHGTTTSVAMRSNTKAILTDAKLASEIFSLIEPQLSKGFLEKALGSEDAKAWVPVGISDRWRFSRYEPG